MNYRFKKKKRFQIVAFVCNPVSGRCPLYFVHSVILSVLPKMASLGGDMDDFLTLKFLFSF